MEEDTSPNNFEKLGEKEFIKFIDAARNQKTISLSNTEVINIAKYLENIILPGIHDFSLGTTAVVSSNLLKDEIITLGIALPMPNELEDSILCIVFNGKFDSEEEFFYILKRDDLNDPEFKIGELDINDEMWNKIYFEGFVGEELLSYYE